MSNCCRRCIVGVFMIFFIVLESVIASSSICTKRKQIGAISSCIKVGEKHQRGRWFPNHLEADNLLSLRGGSSAPADVAKSSGVLTAFPDWVGKTTARCWGILVAAILVEIGATSYLKTGSDSGGFSTAKGAKLTVLSLGLYLISLLSFGMSLRKIDVSIAYAVWSAMGTAVVSVLGILLWGESADRIKIVSLVLIMIGVVGLNLTEGGH